MLGVAIGMIVLVMLGTWIVALTAALSIVGLVPAGHRLKSWFALGGWRFDEIRAVGGVAVEPHLKRYQLAFAAFFVVVIAAAALGVMLGADQQNNTHEDAAVLVHSYLPDAGELNAHHPDARAVAHHGGGETLQVAGQGRRYGKARRRAG